MSAVNMLKVIYLTLALTVIVQGSFIQPPSNIVYRRGDHSEGHMNCAITPSLASGTVLWSVKKYNEATPVVIYARPTFIVRDKYGIQEDAGSTGNYTLTIKNISREDSGTYTCQVGNDVRTANLTVAGMIS